MGDSIHWNNVGHRLIADAIVAAFKSSSITQTLEFSGGAGLPIYGKLFASETDTVLATRNAIEKTNDAGRFQLIVFDNAAGEYRLNGFVNLVGGSVNENYDLLAVTDTYLPRSETRASGGDSNSAEIITGVLDGLESVTINRISPFNPLTSAYTLIKDDDYVFENGTHEDFNLTDTGIDLENATATVSARSTRASCSSQFDGVATIVDADTESPKLRIEWPDAGTDAEIGSNYIWQAKVVDNATNKKTEFEGPLTLKLSSDQ